MGAIMTAILCAMLLFPNIVQVHIGAAGFHDVSLLELKKNSKIYNNSRVRVQGEYFIDHGHHCLVARDQKTGALLVDIWLDIKDDSDIAKENRDLGLMDMVEIGASGDLKNRLKDNSWIVPLPVTPLPAEQLKMIRKYWKRERGKTINIIVIGRFDYVEKGRIILSNDGQMSFVSGFGNRGGWSRRIVAETIVLQNK